MIIYFTGTGNSRFAAQRIAEATGDGLFDCFEHIRSGKGADFTKAAVWISSAARGFPVAAPRISL